MGFDSENDELNGGAFRDEAFAKASADFYFDTTGEFQPRGAPISVQPLQDDELVPPGIIPSMTTRKMFTLAELEQQFSRASVAPSGYFEIRKANANVCISFPEDDPNSGLMTRFEREGIARIHLAQLTTEQPEVEDFYYRAYAKRVVKRHPQGNAPVPLYLPLPTPKPKKGNGSNGGSAGSGRALELAGVLGKISASSSKKPRQQLQMPAAMTKLAGESSMGRHFGILAAVEHIYGAVFAIEDVREDTAKDEYDGKLLAERQNSARGVLATELFLATPLEELNNNQWMLMRFLNFMALAKGKRAVARSIRAIDNPQLTEAVFTRILEMFEFLDVCRHDAAPADIDIFVNSLLGSMVPWIASCPLETIQAKMKILLDKAALPWIALSKAGLILFCILMSRVEIIKNNATGADEVDVAATGWGGTVEFLFDRIQEQDRLADIFANLNGVNSEFYGWQFLALLAMNVDADRKRILVLELRERILMAVQQGDQRSIANLNVFLNALGLDASQLTEK